MTAKIEYTACGNGMSRCVCPDFVMVDERPPCVGKVKLEVSTANICLEEEGKP